MKPHYKFLIVIFIFHFLSSCNSKDLQDTYGNIRMTILSDYEVSMSTKSASAQVADNYKVYLSDAQGQSIKSGPYSEFKDPFVLPDAKDYQIYAENFNSDEAQSLRDGRGDMRLYGSTKFDVTPGNLTNVSFVCSVQNARVSVDYTEAFKAMFKDVTVNIHENSFPERVLSFSKDAQVADESSYAYFNIDEDPKVSIEIIATRNDGVVKNYSKEINIALAQWSRISINSSEVVGQSGLEITVDDVVLSKENEIMVDPMDILKLTLPVQNKYAVFAHYFIPKPMSLDDINDVPNKDIVFNNLIYEISSDATDEQAASAYGGGTWSLADVIDGKILFNNLTPSTSYVFRVRYYNVVSKSFRFTTEAAPVQLPNNGFEEWSSDKRSVTRYSNKDINEYYPNSNKNDGVWKSNNALGVVGATNELTNMGTFWRFDSMISPVNGNSSSKAVEIATKAFYTKSVSGIWYKNEVYNEGAPNDRKVLIGELSLNDYALVTRPNSLSFDYKYSAWPVNGDEFVFYVVLKDASKNEIARAEYTSKGEADFTNKEVEFNYSNKNANVAYISVMIRSGKGQDYFKNTRRVDGDYDATPYSNDRILGSVLSIDNIVLNFEYK